MARLIIRNIGPIKNVDIELNKVNVFIGEQSSGKSTIAKIISFCSWLEKTVNKDNVFFGEGKEAYRRLQTYHHIQSYFREDSVVCYLGENLVYAYNWPAEEQIPYPGWDFLNSEHFSVKEVFLFPSSKVVNPKVIYIPAERNFVSVVPNLQKYAENDDNLMDFLLSWQEARKKYPTSHKLALLNLGMDFYSQDGVSNMVSLPQGGVVALEAASSGLQSIVPLLTLIDWLAKGIYQENKPYSFEEIEKIRHLLDEVGKDLSLSDNDSLKERLAGIVSGKIYTHTQFIIEEPEQNLFPTTQRDLVYYLLKTINHGRKHRLVVTTHSPYILHAFNNSMILGQVQTELPEEFKEKLDCKDAAILPEFVSVWQISDGSLIDIKDGRTNTIGKHYFNDVMNDILDDYYLMVPYLKIAKS